MSRISDFDFEKLAAQTPQGVVRADGGEVLFSVPSRPAAVRFETLFTKEPETMEWINRFEPGADFVDIGANVGMYTIWAAMHRSARVHAFEPETQNVAVLNQNIRLNKLGDRVVAYGAAVMDEAKFSVLNMTDVRPGGAFNSFGEAVGHDLQPRTPVFRQGAMATTLDALVDDGVIPVPEYIKIDVDGFEHKVVKGGREVLADPGVRSVMIELSADLPEHQVLVNRFAELGFDAEPRFSAEFGTKRGGNCLFQRIA